MLYQELRQKFVFETKREQAKLFDKKRSLNQAIKVLKGKTNAEARKTLQEQLKFLNKETMDMIGLQNRLENEYNYNNEE